MKKSFLFGMLLILGVFIIGCSNDDALTLSDDQGNKISLENRDNPALVFFFTGVE